MAPPKTRRRRQVQEPSQEPSSEEKQAGTQRGWISPRTAIIALALVTVLNTANVFFAFYRAEQLSTTLAYTFLAFVTPALAAGLVYFIRRRMTR